MNQATAPQEERNRQPGAPAIAVMAFRATTFALLCAGTGLAFADDIEASAALRARYLALQAQLAKLPPASRAKVMASLETIWHAKQDLEQALGKDPGNALLQELLVNTYQDEMRVLTDVHEASESGRGI